MQIKETFIYNLTLTKIVKEAIIMGYYLEKKKSNHIIDSMVKEGKTFGEIVYKINTQFGFGHSVVKKRLIILRDAGADLGELENVL